MRHVIHPQPSRSRAPSIRMWVAATVTVAGSVLALAATPATTGPADTSAATSRPATASVELPATVEQDLTAVEQHGRKVILLTPPAEYVSWFKGKSGATAMDELRIEAWPWHDDTMVGLDSVSSLKYGITVPLAGHVRRGWSIKLLQSENDVVDIHNESKVAGVVQIDVLPASRYVFPYVAVIKVERPVDGDRGPLTPVSSQVIWSEPEAWTRAN